MSIDLVLRALALGAATGLRTMTGPAAVFRQPRWRVVLPLLALTEYVVDKLPQVGARTDLGPLVARALSGGVCGAALAREAGGDVSLCAAAGSAAAVAAAYAGFAFRTHEPAWLKPIPAALLEDGLAIGIACAATRGRG